jgi:hypothetical protein
MEEPDLNRIRQAVFQLINVRSALEKTQAQLEKTTKELLQLETEIIPDLMHELGLGAIELDGINLQLSAPRRWSGYALTASKT